jgi:hypothetical protein
MPAGGQEATTLWSIRVADRPPLNSDGDAVGEFRANLTEWIWPSFWHCPG